MAARADYGPERNYFRAVGGRCEPTAPLCKCVYARMTKLLMCTIFSLAVVAVLPACTSLEAMTPMASAETVTMTNTPTDQLDKKEARKEGGAYNGNWGYAPGNGL